MRCLACGRLETSHALKIPNKMRVIELKIVARI